MYVRAYLYIGRGTDLNSEIWEKKQTLFMCRGISDSNKVGRSYVVVIADTFPNNCSDDIHHSEHRFEVLRVCFSCSSTLRFSWRKTFFREVPLPTETRISCTVAIRL